MVLIFSLELQKDLIKLKWETLKKYNIPQNNILVNILLHLAVLYLLIC